MNNFLTEKADRLSVFLDSPLPSTNVHGCIFVDEASASSKKVYGKFLYIRKVNASGKVDKNRRILRL